MLRSFEYGLLQLIQQMHNDILDKIMIFITSLGDKGMVWIVLALVLLLFKKTRRCGVAVLVALALQLLLGNILLKNIFARLRPFYDYPTVKLLIDKPGGFSFPSGHTFSSFAAAASVLLYNKKIGIPAIVLASLIAFSRLYLFVHYPTDILAGIFFGILVAFAAKFLAEKTSKVYKSKTKSKVLTKKD